MTLQSINDESWLLDAKDLPKLAFLGPIGTYSHQAAYDRFAESVEYHARRTITDAFHSVDALFSLALLPQENSIFGAVVETYDLLRDSSLGRAAWIRGAVVLPVQHSLVVRAGTRLSDIRRVSSHEQALGQCARFLDTHLPDVKRERVPSTAGAAESLSRESDVRDAAAICSKFCTRLFPGLEVLQEGIQNENHNFTRFYILSNNRTKPLPGGINSGTGRNALLRVQGSDSTIDATRPAGKERSSDAVNFLPVLRLPVMRIDRRPSLVLGQSQFTSVYFVEVSGDVTQDDVAGVEGDGEEKLPAHIWLDQLQAAVTRVEDAGGCCEVLGVW